MRNSLRLKGIYNYILDIIFPINCLSCNQEGVWICQKCIEKIEIETECICPHCHATCTMGEFCQKCQVTSMMNGIIIASSYENKLLQKIISHFKYKYITDLKYCLAEILIRKLTSTSLDLSDITIIPIPLHKKKFKYRGFNQAELLAQALSDDLSIPIYSDIIRRRKNTSAQAQLSSLKRRKNIKNAFNIKEGLSKNFLSNKKVLLVDDVCTTSSTLEECAKELYKLNPKEIWGLVLARGK
jgi:ComF family protein